MACQAIEQLDHQTFRFGRYMEDRLVQMARDAEGLGGNQLYLRAQLEKEQEDQNLLQAQVREWQMKLERLQRAVDRNQQQWETTFALERQAHKAAMTEMQAAVRQYEVEMERRLQL